MGHVFQVKCCENHPKVCSWDLLWLKEIGKGFGKERGIIWYLFMKITENRRKGSWNATGCMWGGKWRKIMENEENRGLVDKKADEDQWERFC